MKKIITILSTFLLVFAFATSVSAATPENLVGWWEFEGDANDSSSYVNNGTPVNVSYETGEVGQAGSFNGSNSYIEVADSASLDITNEITIEAWVKVAVHKNYNAIVIKGEDAAENYELLLYADGSVHCPIKFTDGTRTWLNAPGAITDTEWHHVAMTYKPGEWRIYVDGVKKAERTNISKIPLTNSIPLFIGAEQYSSSLKTERFFNGLIDEVRIWKVALTQEELNDYDDDGVLNDKDLCLWTTPDEVSVGVPFIKLGVNRHIWYGDEEEGLFTTLVPAGKGEKIPTTSQFTITDTYGCSCTQILDSMKATTGFEFGGHYKYGCSKSIIEDWMAGEYYVGPTFIETVEVPAISSTPVSSIATLEAGKDYFLKAYGMVNAGDTIDFDAKYSITNRILGDTWTDTVSGYVSYGTSLLDLFVDSINVDWGSLDETNHTYQIPYAGNGSTVSFLIYDIYYPNNAGNLFIDIIEDKWVDLW